MLLVVNHVPCFSYDGMGNVTVDNLLPPNNYSYDAEGRQITVNGKATTFDTFNRAIEIQSGIGSYAQVVYSPSGQKFAFMNGTTVLGYKAPMAAGMAAVRASDGTGYFQHADWLGSSRFASTGGGTVAYDRAYAPFGEPYAETTTTNRDFTGQTEDTTPGLYDFLFRQQSQSQGRWLAPDPAGLAAVDITNPQTWNRYAYVANNPLSAVDPDGLRMLLVPCCSRGFGTMFSSFPTGFTITGETIYVPVGESGMPYDSALAVFSYSYSLGAGWDSGNGGPPGGDEGGVMAAKQQALGILLGTNPCSGYFNNAASIFTEGANPFAANIFNSVAVTSTNNPTFTATAATTHQGEGVFSTITVNLNSPWSFSVRAQPNGPPRLFWVGPFLSSTPQGRLVEMLHEFGHDINTMTSTAFPLDAGSPAQSTANTNTIVSNCASTIETVAH